MAETMLEGKGQKHYTMSSSNTVSRHISDMAGDVLKQLLHRIQASEFYALQLDESGQQTWRALHSSGYMFVTFMGGQLKKTSFSENHWKPA
jgi:hypothetical protein